MWRSKTCLLLLAGIIGPFLYGLTFAMDLRYTRGAFTSLPLTAIRLTAGELRVGRVLTSPPITAEAFRGGRIWRIQWAHVDAPRAIMLPETVAVLPTRSCSGLGLPYNEDYLISSALTPPGQMIALKNVSLQSFRAPLWPALLVTSSLALPKILQLLRTRLRRRRGGCITCGYSLAGNLSGVCPECGAVVPSPFLSVTACAAGPGSPTHEPSD